MGHTLNGAFKLGIGMALVAATMGTTQAADDKIKVGFMLPYTGTYASLGNAITNGFKQFVAEQGGKIGTGGGGQHGGSRETWGHSVIIDPWGEVLAQQGSQPGVIAAPLDVQKLESIRQSMPVQLHARLTPDWRK